MEINMVFQEDEHINDFGLHAHAESLQQKKIN